MTLPTPTFYEICVAVGSLDRADVRSFLNFDPKNETLPCPKCMDLKIRDWNDIRPEFAQRQKDGTIACVACGTIFTSDEYDDQAEQWFC